LEPRPDQKEVFARALGTVWRQWRRRLDVRFGELGLTQARWGVLSELSRQDEMTQIELARMIGIEGPTLVRLLDGLQKAGLIERRPSAEDRRAKKLRLTEAAMPLIAEMRKIAAESRADVLEGVPDHDLRVATRVLDRIAANLDTFEAGKD
jgi:MarR family transcriptional regulator for hemolysin